MKQIYGATLQRHARQVLAVLRLSILIWVSVASFTLAGKLRLATYDAGLSGEGPGLLLRNIRKNRLPRSSAPAPFQSRTHQTDYAPTTPI
jgi:hypothetical protein